MVVSGTCGACLGVSGELAGVKLRDRYVQTFLFVCHFTGGCIDHEQRPLRLETRDSDINVNVRQMKQAP